MPGLGAAVANDDVFLGYVLGATIAVVAVLLAMGNPAARHGMSHTDVAVTASTASLK